MAETQFVSEDEAVLAVSLQRPIKPFGKELPIIMFREPNAGDITRVGVPVNYVPGADFSTVTFDAAKMSAMMARLARVPEPTIDTMTTGDWTECAWGLARFFIYGMQRTPGAAPSSSPSTSAAAPTSS